MEAVAKIELPLPLYARGKVRDTYRLDDLLLMVASDRISAYDVVLPTLIPDKGRVLTQLSVYWFEKTRHLQDNHLVTADVNDLPSSLAKYREVMDGRFMLVRAAKRIDIECVVREYLVGSAYSEYKKNGSVCGITLEPGLREASKLKEPIFTPATKEEHGHDLNITFEQLVQRVGKDLAENLRDRSINLFRFAAGEMLAAGIIMADTKFEFGMYDGQLILIDEVFTPDSSRFWQVDKYVEGISQPSLDKQFVRDWLDACGWDRESAPPELPADVVEKTRAKYIEAYERITGKAFAWK